MKFTQTIFLLLTTVLALTSSLKLNQSDNRVFAESETSMEMTAELMAEIDELPKSNCGQDLACLQNDCDEAQAALDEANRKLKEAKTAEEKRRRQEQIDKCKKRIAEIGDVFKKAGKAVLIGAKRGVEWAAKTAKKAGSAIWGFMKSVGAGAVSVVKKAGGAIAAVAKAGAEAVKKTFQKLKEATVRAAHDAKVKLDAYNAEKKRVQEIKDAKKKAEAEAALAKKKKESDEAAERERICRLAEEAGRVEEARVLKCLTEAKSDKAKEAACSTPQK